MALMNNNWLVNEWMNECAHLCEAVDKDKIDFKNHLRNDVSNNGVQTTNNHGLKK